MIKCKCCGEEKEEDDYNDSILSPLGYDIYCKDCRSKKTNNARLNRSLKALYIYNMKCGNCGMNNILLLSFHNSKGTESNEKITNMILKEGKMDNIELLCANCHILADIRDGTDKKLRIRKKIIELLTEEKLEQLDAELDPFIEAKIKKKEGIRTDDDWNALLRSTIP